jgi:hypothetical protein
MFSFEFIPLPDDDLERLEEAKLEFVKTEITEDDSSLEVLLAFLNPSEKFYASFAKNMKKATPATKEDLFAELDTIYKRS